eukprot:scaffold186318_cov40-Tisochrysis_lutea.AAC.2
MSEAQVHRRFRASILQASIKYPPFIALCHTYVLIFVLACKASTCTQSGPSFKESCWHKLALIL